ncbi:MULTISPECIES: ABC transporter ATP-binding protein [Bradyrhizobium]|uniref:ABC transporter ATP-binding protein n=3 Tax=Bradyrhizobium TaxID=374 RepID=A0AAE5X8W8_9BRAD|nr:MULTISPECIES: ABC transporter ATP-binding protein [Bradyrhizobium]MCG2628256.1 ABC transporter ATP-binding protein [Bradyrhizobium zhengyangense]MCG2643375.1 ABC transporter ATP-binding protein [Bradyrhizobium zhengyangense]MCG2670311.1 ABC transporter ATP-binding protein [Bradyrhizobium zhengyangense]MDN4985955.1 ABC transporter ATP-binding protein [Bradyrhizobium sp. WYCCWR 13022]MDN5002665.1 ABC transporter ATP-binding protein [Bradyrhizobium sp. WYCCWR 12677]
MTDLLRLEAVTAGYGYGAAAIENVALSLPRGSSLAVLGRNGVGKTSLLATIMGLTQMASGKITFDGGEIGGIDTYERARLGLGYVPQEREIFPSLTVEENLSVARVDRGKWNIESVFELFPRLAERRQNFGNHLSGGEQQMLAVGRALVSNPALLILDEPFEGLAPVIVDQLVEALKRIRKESDMTFILVEHHVDLALSLTVQALILDRGQVVWNGKSNDLAGNKSVLSSLVGIS